MLKNIFNKNNGNQISFEDKMEIGMRGELEIIAERDGEIIHHDKGNNVVTRWAKHSTATFVASGMFSKIGDSTEDGFNKRSIRSVLSADHSSTPKKNNDGTMISNEKYFDHAHPGFYDGINYLNHSIHRPGTDFKYALFPTKMLFGTGREWANWSSIPEEFKGYEGDVYSYRHPDHGAWTEEFFDQYVQENPSNYYSANWDSENEKLIKTRTMNEVNTTWLPEDTFNENSFGIPGAIKNSTVINQTTFDQRTTNVSGQIIPNNDYRGIGLPSFIYVKRTDVAVMSGQAQDVNDDLMTRITFTVILPEQQDGEFYPYNGYYLKCAGLFCDSKFQSLVPNYSDNSVEPLTDAVSERNPQEIENYKKMPGGMMWAARRIAPVYKDHRTRITAIWTLYIP